MVPTPTIRSASNPLNLIALVIVVGVLYVMRDVCIPFILAVLLTFVLSPVVGQLQKWRVSRVPAVFMVGGLLLATLGFGGWLVGGQLVSLAEKLPQYQANVHEKFKSFQTSPGGVVDRVNHSLNSLLKEVETIGSKSAAPAGAASPAKPDAAGPTTAPIEVAVVEPKASKVVAIESLLMGALSPVTTFGIVSILSLFMLIRQEDVRDRAIRLLGGGQLHVATQALDEAGQRVSRYLIAQLIINAAFGLCIVVGLYCIGVPYSLMWGLLAACARFVPFFGAPISAIGPVGMAFATTPGWSVVVMTIVLFAVLELVIANLVEPLLYGSNTRISPLAIIVSAIFWSWLWGPVGLLLSTPLTVCLVVIGWHVPRLRFLSVLLGDEPALAPEARFYQRLLAADQAEAWEIAEHKLRDSSLVELYDTLIIPALILAEEDRNHGNLDDSHEKYIFQSVRDLLEDLAERPVEKPAPVSAPVESAAVTARAAIGSEAGDDAAQGASHPSSVVRAPKVLCIPANDEADEMAAIMLSHLLIQRGIRVEVISCKTLAGERLELVKEQEATLVCVSAVPPEATRHARFMCKRLSSVYPTLKIVAGLWHTPDEPMTLQHKMPAGLASAVVTSLAAASERIAALANHETYRTDEQADAPIAAASMASNPSANRALPKTREDLLVLHV